MGEDGIFYSVVPDIDFLGDLHSSFTYIYATGALSDIVSEGAFFQRPVEKLLVL